MYAEYYRSPEKFLNIHYLDDDPVAAAQMHCDAHVRKGIVETSQILSAVWLAETRAHADDEWTGALTLDWAPATKDTPYRGLGWLHARLFGQRVYACSATEHPCVEWARLYGGNYAWLHQLGAALLDEFAYRFDGKHSCMYSLRTLEVMPPTLLATADKWCEAPAVLPPEFVLADSIASYQAYYRKSRMVPLAYTRRPEPDWLRKEK